MNLFHLLVLSYILVSTVIADTDFIQTNAEYQESNIVSEHAKAHQKFYESLDPVADPGTEKTIRQFSESQFNLGTYQTNYFLPFSHRNNGDYQNRTYSQYYPKTTETEFQFSVRVDYVTMLFGHDVTCSFGYTQKSYWQTYVHRAYFRESNYNPELFMMIPTYHALDRLHIKQFGLYLGHQSNGRGELQSDANLTSAKIERSWNYLAGSVLFQTGALFTEIKGWYRIPDNTDYNPDLMAYIGYGYVKFKYPYGKHLFSLKLRHGLNRHYGSIDAAYSYPLSSRDDLFYYVKYFSGYEESLIDYDQYVNKIAVGFAFSR